MLNVAVVGANGLMLIRAPDESTDRPMTVAGKKLSARSDISTVKVAVDAGNATKLLVFPTPFRPAALSPKPFMSR